MATTQRGGVTEVTEDARLKNLISQKILLRIYVIICNKKILFNLSSNAKYVLISLKLLLVVFLLPVFYSYDVF